MLDQLKIGAKSSLDFGASVAERTISQPKKKEIKETIPFSNITYDFSAINGELYWEERELEYIFEILADTPQELEEKKIAFASWVMNVMNENIYDPFISGYHFVGTFSEMEFADEDCVEKTTATVKFAAYPYKVANDRKVYHQTVSGKATMNVENNSSHRLTPTLTVDGSVSIKLGNNTYSVSSGTYTDDDLKLSVGLNVLEVENKSGRESTVTISFYEEVF